MPDCHTEMNTGTETGTGTAPSGNTYRGRQNSCKVSGPNTMGWRCE
jgi:hypothetical protein